MVHLWRHTWLFRNSCMKKERREKLANQVTVIVRLLVLEFVYLVFNWLDAAFPLLISGR